MYQGAEGECQTLVSYLPCVQQNRHTCDRRCLNLCNIFVRHMSDGVLQCLMVSDDFVSRVSHNFVLQRCLPNFVRHMPTTL